MVGRRRQRRPRVSSSTDDKLTRKETEPKGDGRRAEPRGKSHFRSGLALDPQRKVLYSLDIDGGTIAALDLETGKELKSAPAGDRPYDVATRPQRQPALRLRLGRPRGARRRSRPTCAPSRGSPSASIPTRSPFIPSDDRLFVACASSNCVSVIDTRRGIVTETIHTALFPQAPEGSTPDALAVAPDGKTLFVANADNNCVAVIDIADAEPQPGQGLHSHRLVSDRRGGHARRQEAAGRRRQGEPDQGQPDQRRHGQATRPNTIRVAKRRILPFPYIGTTLSGSLSIVPVPDDKTLAAYTETVYKNCPYSDKLLTDAPHPEKTAIPTRVGDPSPIKHVLYIIKENRTYDQVFGDLPRGNGDPSLVMFGRDVTPNHHKLAEEFVLLDNLYCNGHVSADGHPWSTMAYNTDYIARNWALDLLEPGRDRRRRRRRPVQRPLGLSLGRLRPGGPDLSQLRRIRPPRQPAGRLAPRSKGPCRAWSATCAPTTASPRSPASRSRDTDNAETFLTRVPASSRRTATCLGSWS